MIDAIVAGHLCLDIIPTILGRGPVVAGRMVEAGPAALATGGAVSNTGLALHRLGLEVALAGKIGDDFFGGAIRDVIARHSPALAASLLLAPGQSSSYTVILSPPATDRTFIHHVGTNAGFGSADLPDALLSSARLLHLGYPPLLPRLCADDGAELAEIFRRAKALGLTTSLDMTMPDPSGATGSFDWRAILANVLPHTDLLLPSVEEMLLMLDRPAFERHASDASGAVDVARVPPEVVVALGDTLLGLGAKLVMLKLGHRGFYLRSHDLGDIGRAAPASPDGWSTRQRWAPCFAAALVGTTGAGDATVAGLLAGLLRGASLDDSLLLAAAVGACSVEAADAVSGVRGWEATRQRLAAPWPQQPTGVDALPGWIYADNLRVWVGPADGMTHR